MSPIVPSVCFRTVEIAIKHQRKILTNFFLGGMAPSASFWLRLCQIAKVFMEILPGKTQLRYSRNTEPFLQKMRRDYYSNLW